MLSRLVMRAAPLVVALAVIALLPTVALLGRLGLLTDPMVLAFFVLVLGFLAVGLVTTVRRVGNPIGWLLLWQGVIAGLSLLSAAYGMYDLQVAAEPLPGGSLLLWTSTWIWLAALAVSPVIHVLFPDGRLLSRRWAGVIWLALASMVLAMAAIAVAAWPLSGPVLLEGPSWGPELDPPPPLALVGLALFGVAEAASLTAMAIRLRRAKGDEREQIKWFLYAGSFVILGITVEVVLGVPITIASWLGGMVVPFAIAVALFKYRLYDIDRLINRTWSTGSSPPSWDQSTPLPCWSSGTCSAESPTIPRAGR
jgi:two-component system, NarL family, sensor kinase